MWCMGKKFDHMAAVTNFVIVPLTFLSGTFYTIERLPEFWRFLANWNLFYIIDGFRYGCIDASDSNIIVGIFFLGISNIIFFLILTIRIFKKGYCLKG